MKSQFEPGLVGTQRWMQEFIVAPEGAPPALEADHWVTASSRLTATERASIYRDMYLARLGDALEPDYPGLLHYLGHEAFGALVARYVEAHPSRRYTLNRLGDHFPEFIAAMEDRSDRGFLHDLARLELAITTVFDAEESPALTPEAIAAVPGEAWETARLQLSGALQLLAFDYPVNAYLTAIRAGDPLPGMGKHRSWVAVYRRDYSVRRMDLKRPAFELLRALATGKPFGEAVVSSRVRPKQLFGWFREWTSEGFFQSVSL